MSEHIDERVVSIQFDNSGFEEKVSETQKSLEKLNDSMTFDGAKEGIKNSTEVFKTISDEAEKTNVSPVTNAVEEIKNKFTMLEIVGVGALLKIGEEVVNLGRKMVNTIAIAPISSGFNKYQQILTSQQALTAALGGETEKEIADNAIKIQKDLDLLTKYADETSYSLSDMISNLSKFANYGIDLDDAAYAMMGIGNASAKSGQPLWKATHAMEGFSKAMGQGYMSYQIWNHQLKTAEIGTMDFKNTFIETAKEMLRNGVDLGHSVRLVGDDLEFYKSKSEGWLKVSESFNESLTKGRWMTNDVMLAGLAKYSTSIEDLFEASDRLGVSVTEILNNGSEGFDKYSTEAFKYAQQSKTLADVTDSLFDAISTTWYGIFQSLIGDYKQTVEVWSNFAEYVFEWFVYPLQDVAAVIKEFSKSTSNIIDETTGKAMTMREVFVGSFMNILEAITSVIEPIKEAFTAVFKPLDSMPDVMQKGVEGMYKFTKGLILTEEEANKFRNTLISIFSVIKKIVNWITTFVDILKIYIWPVIKKIASFAMKFVGSIIKIVFKTLSIISAFISETFGVVDVMDKFKQEVIDAADSLDEANESVKDNMSSLEESSKHYTTWADKLQEVIKQNKEAKGAVDDLTDSIDKNKKSAILAAGYDGSTYLTYAQAQEKANNKILAEYIEEAKITKDQYNKFIKMLVAKDLGTTITWDEMSRSTGLEVKQLQKLNSIINQTTVAYTKTDKAIQDILNKDKEAEQWDTLWDGINYAQKLTMITYGDQQKALNMYYKQGIKNYAEIAEAIGIEEWKIREVISAYEEAYRVETYLNKKRQEATMENINEARKELGYIKDKNKEKKKMTFAEAREAREASRQIKISERVNNVNKTAANSSSSFINSMVSSIKKLPVVNEVYSTFTEIFKIQELQAKKVKKNVNSVSTEITKAINAAGGIVEDEFYTTKKNLYETKEAADETANSISNIGNSSKKASTEVKQKTNEIKEDLKDTEKQSKEIADKINENLETADIKSYGDSMREFFGEKDSTSPEKTGWALKFDEIWAVIKVGAIALKEDLSLIFSDPSESLSNALETIKGTINLIKSIFKSDEENKEAGVLGAIDYNDISKKQSLLDIILGGLQKIRDFLDEGISWKQFFNLSILNHEMKIMAKILKNFYKSVDFSGLGDTILKTAVGIGILVAALFIMCKLDHKALVQSIEIFELLAVVLAKLFRSVVTIMAFYNLSMMINIPQAISGSLTKLFGGSSVMEDAGMLLEGFGKSLLMFTASIAILMLAMDKIENPKVIYIAIGVLFGFMTAIMALVLLVFKVNRQMQENLPKINIKFFESFNKKFDIATILAEFAKMLAIYGGLFIALTYVIDKEFLNKEGEFQSTKFVLVASLLVAMTATVLYIAQKMIDLYKKVGTGKIINKKMTSFARMLLIPVASILILAKVYNTILEGIDSIDNKESFAYATLVVGVLIATILSVMLAMGYLSKKVKGKKELEAARQLSKTMITVAFSILIMAAAVGSLYAATAYMKGDNSIITYFIGLIAIFALLIATVVGLSTKINKTKIPIIKTLTLTILGIAAAVAIMSKAIGVMCIDLKSVEPEIAKTALIAMGVIFTIMSAMFALIAGVGLASGGASNTILGIAVGIFAAFGATILMLASSVYVLGKGLIVLSKGLKVVADSKTDFINGLNTIKEALPIFKDIIIGTISAIIGGIIGGIVQSITDICTIVVEGFITLLNTILKNAPRILTSIKKLIPLITEVLGLILTAIFTALNTAFPQFRIWFMNLVSLVEEAIGSILTFLKETGVPKLIEILEVILDYLFKKVVPRLKNEITGFIDWIGNDVVLSILTALTNIYNAIVIFITLTVFPGIEKVWDDFLKMIDSLITSFLTFLKDGVTNWGGQIVDIIVSLIEVIEDGSTKITEAIESLLITVSDNVLKLFKTGGSVLAKIILIPAAIWEGFLEEMYKQFGINKKGEKDEKNGKEGIFSLGVHIIEGLINGIKSMIEAVVDVAKNVWSWFYDTITKESETESPSKKMIEFGTFLGDGLVIGVNRSASAITKSAIGFMKAFTDPAKDELDSFSIKTSSLLAQLLNADMNFDPVITPIVDMSNFNKATASMDSFFSSKKAMAVSGVFTDMKTGQMEVQKYQNEGISDGANTSTFNYVQNNYSPKALSAIDIYRRTKNQLTFRTQGG